jgi:hypothetical protein
VAGLPRFNGAHMATVLAAAIAIFTLGAAQTLAELDEANDQRFLAIGKAWMPHAEHIGPYSGKETVMAVAWLVSWAVLHVALRKHHVDPRPWFGAALVLMLLGVLGIWPPVWHFLAG